MKKQILILMTALLILPMIMAWDLSYDNVKTFNKSSGYGTATIWDSDLMSGDDKLAEITLLKNSDKCLIDCFAEGTITLNEKNKIFDSFRFKNIRNDNYEDLDYTFYLKINDKWIEYSGDEKTGIYEWRLEAKKSPYESIDWLGTFFGFEIDEWALWGSGILLYYDFNSIENLVTDGALYNLTNNIGSPIFTSTNAKIPNSAQINVTDNFNISVQSEALNFTTGNKSLNFWVRPDNLDNNLAFLDKRKGDGIERFFIGTDDAGSGSGIQISKLFGAGSSYQNTSTFFTAGTWTMVTLSLNDTHYSLYINGTMINNSDSQFLFSGGSDYNMHIGMNYLGKDGVNGTYDEMGFWNKSLSPSEVNLLWNNGDGLLYGTGSDYITVTLSSPINNTNNITTTNIPFIANYTVDSNAYNLTNATYNIWYSNGSLFNQSTRTVTGDTTNGTILNINNFVVGNYKWNVESCGENATGTLCVYQSTNNTFKTASIINSINFNATTYETSREKLELNITPFNSLTPTNPILTYNGTNYTASATSSGSNYLISANVDVPLTDTLINKTFNFTWNLNGNSETSSNYEQQINRTILTLCNSTFTLPYINFTFKDESTDADLTNVTIPLGEFTYYLGNGNINKTYSYTNTTGYPSYAFCYSPSDRNISVETSLQYKQDTYPQRTYNPSTLILANISTDKTLYLLGSASGIYVTFQVINSAEQSLSGVEVSATRNIGGSDTIVGSGTTGAEGGVTFFLNPDFTHTFTFSKSGYTTYTTSFAPTQSGYTISLGAGDVTTTGDYFIGISYEINPTNQTLFNDTAYDFDFILTSDYWDVTQFGFVLINSSNDVVASSSVSDNGGTATTNYNVGNSTSHITMNYYWIIEGNYTNSTRSWYIMSSAGTDLSWKTFFEDFKRYTTDGESLLGLNDFGRGILVFIIIFVFVGIMSFKFGLVSPAGISGLVFSLVLFFDVGLELLPNPISAVSHFPTIFVGLIMIAIIINEVYYR